MYDDIDDVNLNITYLIRIIDKNAINFSFD